MDSARYEWRSALTDGVDEPVSALVSMSCKRGTDAAKTKYDGDPQFADGTNSGQWFESEGRLNMDGNYIGTPGMPHQDDAGQITSAKAPASLPVGSIVINEIYNGGAGTKDLQWIELHSPGTDDKIVKNYEMEAVWKRDDGLAYQRVFNLPGDDNVKVLAGGYLLITNKYPAECDLAGSINVLETAENIFPKVHPTGSSLGMSTSLLKRISC